MISEPCCHVDIHTGSYEDTSNISYYGKYRHSKPWFVLSLFEKFLGQKKVIFLLYFLKISVFLVKFGIKNEISESFTSKKYTLLL